MPDRARLLRLVRPFVLGGLALSLTSCALHYRDPKTGTEHLWGFGHLKMRATEPHEGVKAVVTGIQTFGVAANVGGESPGFSLGYQSLSVLRAVEENTALSLEGPSADLFTLRVGARPPESDPDQLTDPAEPSESRVQP